MRTLLPSRRDFAVLSSVAMFLALFTVFAPIGRAQSEIFRPLTPGQARLVAAKAAALGGAGKTVALGGGPEADGPVGTRDLSPGVDSTSGTLTAASFVGPEARSRLFDAVVPVTKADRIAAEAAALEGARLTLDLASRSDPGRDGSSATDAQQASGQADDLAGMAADTVAELERRLEETRSLPDGHVDRLTVQGVETGAHSIKYGNVTYSGIIPKDPVNVVFYGNGSAQDVYYDLRNWASRRWSATGCGIELFTRQRVYIWDASHAGGWDGWQDQFADPADGMGQLERNAAFCGSSRYHLRLFGGHVPDSDPNGFGEWSVTAAHWDYFGHLVAGSWERAEDEVEASVKSGGRPMWFVGRIWSSWIGNRGTFQVSTNDGYATFVELRY